MEPMSARYDCADAGQKEAGLVAAVTAIQQGGLVVLPTDTVYGLGADAFTPQAITALDTAKGRGRSVPPPVLVGSVRAAAALTESLGAFGQDLIDEFWPGPLTLILRASPTLKWDLGDARGTVSVRMPPHPVALDLLRRTGPMAVTGANRKGHAAALYLLSYYLGSSILGSIAGHFWQSGGWSGIAAFGGAAILLALWVAVRLQHGCADRRRRSREIS